MNGSHILDGAQIWSLAIIAGPIILGAALAYGLIQRRRRDASNRAAPEYRRDEGER